jgi:2-hydroxy-3-keto-5-methylthiopentenyl-1-phosphate phosphatase
MRKPNIAILSDFDGTITSINVLEQLYKNFAAPSFTYYVEQWENGIISSAQEIEGCFASIKATQIEMEAFLSTVSIDFCLKELIRFCEEKNIPFAIVSDGLSWYINYILNCHGINNVTVYANEINFHSNRFRFSFPWFDIQEPFCGTSKKAIVRNFQNLGFSVVFIGDGLSDVGAAETTDVLFSRGFLSEYAKTNNIKGLPFSSLCDVLELLGDMK